MPLEFGRLLFAPTGCRSSSLLLCIIVGFYNVYQQILYQLAACFTLNSKIPKIPTLTTFYFVFMLIIICFTILTASDAHDIRLLNEYYVHVYVGCTVYYTAQSAVAQVKSYVCVCDESCSVSSKRLHSKANFFTPVKTSVFVFCCIAWWTLYLLTQTMFQLSYICIINDNASSVKSFLYVS